MSVVAEVAPAQSWSLVGMALLTGRATASPNDPIESAIGAFRSASA